MKNTNDLKTFRRILFIDFETRSEADLQEVGAHKYCLDPTTEILLVSYAFDDRPVNVVTLDELPQEVWTILEERSHIKVAHNAEFDMAVAKYVMKLNITYEDWFDTAYQAAYYGYPRALGHLAKILRTAQKASQDELKLFSHPVAKAKGVAEDEFFSVAIRTRWNNETTHPAEWQRFKEYAAGDVVTMRECFDKMRMLPDIELFTMQVTFEMNFNGYPFDVKLANRIYEVAKTYEKEAGDEALERFGITNLRSVPQVKKALIRENVYLDSLNKKERGGVEHPILDLRDQATGAAFSKIPTAIARLCHDGRLRGEFKGHGAHTGRWSAHGTQPQNFARILDPDKVCEDLSHVDSYSVLRQHLRLCIGNVKGSDFTCADLSQIEARIVAWLAGCKWRTDAFANGVDIYARSAEKMFNKQNVTKNDIERQYGKCAELGFGYGGGHVAIKNIQPDFYREQGEAKIQELVQQWRTANPEICQLWRSLERGFRDAIKTGKGAVICGATTLTFQFDGSTARINLPSGRALYYRGVSTMGTQMGVDLYYLDYSRGGEHPIRVKFWGGTLLENITQAIAKDVLTDIMERVKRNCPYAELIGTVHDEIWYLTTLGKTTLNTLLEEMARPIAWAKGLITKGDGFTSDRYRK